MRRKRPRVAVVAVLILAPLALGLTGCQKFQARMELKRGNDLYADEVYKEAIAQFQKGLALDPSATFAWRSVGLAAMALYRPGVETPENRQYAETAVDAFKKYLAAFPKDEKVEEYLITTLINAKKYDEALSRLKTQGQKDPTKAGVDGVIVATLTKAGRLEEAYTWAKRRPDPTILYGISVAAWDKAYNDPMLDKASRGKFVDLGLEAAAHSLRLKSDYYEAMTYYNLLFREKAKLEDDPLKAQEWYAKATEWRDKAIAARDAQAKKEAVAAAAAAKVGS
jgi:tetratricopeptide (TPR) repeat protein